MDSPMSNLNFIVMSAIFKIRDFLIPRERILEEVEIKPGSRILDFGCGPGSYSLVAAEIVGKTGKVYALDIHPLAVERVRESASKRGLTNIETIRSNCKTGLEDESMDVVFLYDIFHMLSEPDAVLEELHRVLKPEGILSFSDHHMKKRKILSGMTGRGLFELSNKGQRTYQFSKVGR